MSNYSIPVPNSFQLPNVLIDHWLGHLSAPQFAVLLVICRKTWGWHKEVDMISNSQIQQLTGFGKKVITRACKDLQALKLITCKKTLSSKGDSNPNIYGVLVQQIYAGENAEIGKLPVRKCTRRRSERDGGVGAPDTLPVGAPDTPTKNNDTKPTIQKVNDSDAGAQAAPLAEVVAPAAPSLTQKIEKPKKSLFKGKPKFSDEQRFCLEWLKTLQLDTSEDTLSWWARTYPMMRLDEVHREALKRKPDSIGAYMQMLLKKQAVVVTGRVELNKEYAKEFKEFYKWKDLEIHQKFASVVVGNQEIEIEFNMEHEAFREYLTKKYDNLNRKL